MASLKELMAAKKAQIAESSGKRTPTVKPPVGKTRFRILPSWRGIADSTFFQEFGQHFIKDAKGNMLAVYVCVEKTFAKPCPLCDAVRDGVFAAENDDDKKTISEARASGRILLNALQVEKDTNTPIILELSPTTFDKLIDIYQENVDDENEEFNILTDMVNGVDVIITRSGAGINTEYSVQPALKGSKPVNKAVIAKLINLDEHVAQEYALGLAKATTAIKALLGASSQKAITKADDEEFDDSDDVSNYSTAGTAGTDDAIEGDYTEVSDESVSDDELSALLDDLDD